MSGMGAHSLQGDNRVPAGSITVNEAGRDLSAREVSRKLNPQCNTTGILLASGTTEYERAYQGTE